MANRNNRNQPRQPDFPESEHFFWNNYVATGRLIEYPLWLVQAKEHLYCRWDDVRAQWLPRERLNIEATGQGLSVPPDSHYDLWPCPQTDEDRRMGCYGRSLSLREELQHFLNNRGQCLLCNNRREEAIQCFEWCEKLAHPQDLRWARQLESILHPPQGRVYIPKRQYVEETQQARNPSAEYHENAMLPAIKIPLGMARPHDLPFGRRVEYVPAHQADLFINGQLVPGRTYKVAIGRPLPKCLPPNAPLRFVSPEQADDFSPYEPQFGSFAPVLPSPGLPEPQPQTPRQGQFPGNLPKPDLTRQIHQNQISRPGFPE